MDSPVADLQSKIDPNAEQLVPANAAGPSVQDEGASRSSVEPLDTIKDDPFYCVGYLVGLRRHFGMDYVKLTAPAFLSEVSERNLLRIAEYSDPQIRAVIVKLAKQRARRIPQPAQESSAGRPEPIWSDPTVRGVLKGVLRWARHLLLRALKALWRKLLDFAHAQTIGRVREAMREPERRLGLAS